MEKNRVLCWMYSPKCFRNPSTKPHKENGDFEEKETSQRKPGGWKTMPYIIGNETFEKLATLGLLANFIVYLQTKYHLDQVFAANIIYIWSGVCNFLPLAGAFLSDAYLGRFGTLAFTSVASFMGMVVMTLTAALPGLRPRPCSRGSTCEHPTAGQFSVLYASLFLLAVGAAGIRPCSLPFGVDQFDPSTPKGRQGINSFFNWYYFSFTFAMMIALTLVVYIQSSVSWALGLGIPAFLMFGAVVMFFFGMKVYVYVEPEGSVFSSVCRVFVAAFRKRKLKMEEMVGCVMYEPEPVGTKLKLTDQFRFLSKAAIITDADELNPDGSPVDPWRLCPVQQVEEAKCLLRVAPVWASGVICFTAVVQMGTFSINQATKMDRHIGPNFKIPPGSLTVFAMLTLTFWIPIYDRVIVPALRPITMKETGITLLQRMGIGLFISIISMLAAAIVESHRRSSALTHPLPDGLAAMSALWLVPQFVLSGLAEAFNAIGQIEFYYREFPENMRSLAGSLFFCTMAFANFLSSFIVNIIHRYTGKNGHPNWLENNLNLGRLDLFYYFIAGMGVVNLVYFMVCAKWYRYKDTVTNWDEEVKSKADIESKPYQLEALDSKA
ncbi:protein NRT1/ PTR FAMILY 2.13 [Amborella trichopoda]|nr:protein NRT1/ PTR FAMILY 2.13 [Amborella trichopoda]|eukprot:XP_006838787.2 protein NRT1/ PTR FAMILY 2.13 [Amborella trichopoda]